jgi:hypothetical protein
VFGYTTQAPYSLPRIVETEFSDLDGEWPCHFLRVAKNKTGNDRDQLNPDCGGNRRGREVKIASQYFGIGSSVEP